MTDLEQNRDWWREQALMLEAQIGDLHKQHEADLDGLHEQAEALKERVRRAVDDALAATDEAGGDKS